MSEGSRNVLLPLAAAFLIFWLGQIDLTGSFGKYKPVEARKPGTSVTQQ